MEKKFYPVFDIDICFDDCAGDNVLVGAESIEDILNHFKEIFPDYKYELTEEDFYEEDGKLICVYGEEYKLGDIRSESWFTNEEIEEFKESLDKDNMIPRIKLIPNLYTNIPYKEIHSYGYME